MIRLWTKIKDIIIKRGWISIDIYHLSTVTVYMYQAQIHQQSVLFILAAEKHPLFQTFKAMPSGRMARELREADYNDAQIFCAVHRNVLIGDATVRCWKNAVLSK